MSDTNGRDELSASGMGFSGSLKTKETVLTLAVVLAFLGLSYVVYAQHVAQDLKFDAIIKQMNIANELSYLQTYTLSRPQNERVPIMPPSQLWKYIDQDTLREREDIKRR